MENEKTLASTAPDLTPDDYVDVPVVGGLARVKPVDRFGVHRSSQDGRVEEGTKGVRVSWRMLGAQDASDMFALRVMDNSFSDNLLCSGDVLLVAESDELRVGKVCLVEIRRRDGEFVETVIGRVRLDDALILLESSGPRRLVLRCDLFKYVVLMRGVIVAMVREGI